MKIITLVAYHISTNEALYRLVKLLESIRNQVDYVDDLDVKISISHDKTMRVTHIMDLLKMIKMMEFKFYFQENQMNLFEHYDFLTKQLNTDEDIWILFSDDGFWAENRLAAYHCMIHNIPEMDYSNTTAIYYRSNSQENSYTDYCVRLKYLKIFFMHATPAQMKHDLCQYYFIKFIHSYGRNILRLGHCQSDAVLYEQTNIDDDKLSIPEGQRTVPEQMMISLDLFMAKHSKQNVEEWLKFCDINSDNMITKGNISDDTKRQLIKIYLDNYGAHLFNNKYLPIYSQTHEAKN